MYKNVGKKLKEISWYIFCICSSFGVCAAYTFWKIVNVLSDQRVLAIALTVILAIFNIVVSYAISLALYGLGDIVIQNGK